MGNSRKNKEEIAEDYCFACKDGGHLRVCDYKNCLKAYHPQCVEKDPNFLESEEQFICNWHTCFICKRSSYFHCFCCPSYSVCRGCIKQAVFVQVKKQTKGFCNNCLRLAILIEKNVDVDSDGERVDFRDTETYEFLFKDYWEIVKDKEGLTLVDLEEAIALLKRGLNYKQGSDSEKLPDEERISDEDFLEDNGDDESSFLRDLKSKSNKVKTLFKKSKPNKKTYLGWGSKELIGFLSSIGKDTSESLDHVDVSEIVKEYVQQNNLFQPDKKKKYVLCDDKLRSLFRKRKLKYHKIFSLLETHFAGNATSEDESLVSSEDGNDSVTKKKARTMSFEAKIPKRVSEKNKRYFASLVGENIKLIYLKRSLIVDLLKHPDTFEHKVVGCFVRVKNDPKDYNRMSQKLYLLGQVTGIKKSSGEYKIGDTCTDILLCVSNMWAEVKISSLSDDNCEEEECEDLRLLVKKGLFKKPTVAELEEKVRSVHGDIVSHWIDRELVRLQRLIDQANEKGWRRELFEYIDKRQLLRTSAERQRLLEEVPQVIPDTEEEMKYTNGAADDSFEENRGATGQVAAACSGATEERLEGTTRDGAVCLKSCTEEKPKGAEGSLSSEIATERTPEGSTVQGADSSIAIEEAPEGLLLQQQQQQQQQKKNILSQTSWGATGQGASSFEGVTEETLKGATEQDVAACVVASEGTPQGLESNSPTCDIIPHRAVHTDPIPHVMGQGGDVRLPINISSDDGTYTELTIGFNDQFSQVVDCIDQDILATGTSQAPAVDKAAKETPLPLVGELTLGPTPAAEEEDPQERMKTELKTLLRAMKPFVGKDVKEILLHSDTYIDALERLSALNEEPYFSMLPQDTAMQVKVILNLFIDRTRYINNRNFRQDFVNKHKEMMTLQNEVIAIAEAKKAAAKTVSSLQKEGLNLDEEEKKLQARLQAIQAKRQRLSNEIEKIKSDTIATQTLASTKMQKATKYQQELNREKLKYEDAGRRLLAIKNAWFKLGEVLKRNNLL